MLCPSASPPQIDSLVRAVLVLVEGDVIHDVGTAAAARVRQPDVPFRTGLAGAKGQPRSCLVGNWDGELFGPCRRLVKVRHDDSLRHPTSSDVAYRYRRSAHVYCGRMSWGNRADRIDHNGPELVWEQVRDDLLADLDSGELPPGARLPSEQALADDVYGVSRPTVRRAIAALVEQGRLTVVHGRGTFVAARP